MEPKLIDTVFVNATVLDGTRGMQPRPHQAIAVHDGKILHIATIPEGADPQAFAGSLLPDARVVDVAGGFLMPGLINLHVHLFGNGMPFSPSDVASLLKEGEAGMRDRLKASALTQLASGVTTVRGAADPDSVDIWVRDQIRAGRFVGPRIIAAGNGVTVPGGHGAGLFAYVCDTPEAACAHIRDLAEQGADVTKLLITGGVFDAEKVGEPGVLRMPSEMVEAACAESHRLGLPVMAHVESTEGLRVALEGGVDTIEHGAPMTPEIERLYLEGSDNQLPGRKPTVTCTISPALPFVKLSGEQTHSTDIQKINGEIVCAGIIKSARRAMELGIPVGLGTDSSCPYVTQYDFWRELAYFAKYTEASNADALHAGTQGNAEILGLGELTGTIAEGYAADILVTADNPLQDLRALSKPEFVMAEGSLLERPEIKHIPELDAELDRILADDSPLPKLED